MAKKIQNIVLYFFIFIQFPYLVALQLQDLFISPESLLKDKHLYTIIDIRKDDKFKLGHIDSSINLPLGSIAKKKYLSSKSLVLVSSGYNSDTIVRQCEKLRKDKFTVLVLKGGINAWAIRNLPLSAYSNSFSIFEISPLELYKSIIGTAKWLAINFSKETINNKFLKNIETINIPDPDLFLKNNELFSSISRKAENKKLLIYTKNGSGYLNIFKVIKNRLNNSVLQKNTAKSDTDNISPFDNLFFLKGGINNFDLFTKRVLKFPAARKILSSEDECDCN